MVNGSPAPTSSTVRAMLEVRENAWLAPTATRSANQPRLHPDDESDLRTAFQRDRDRIVHSRAFRRLMHKTQVFIAPAGDQFRTRLTHTIEVTQIARTIGRALRLNEDLVEAIGLGHDLGHTPFGHMGERALGSVFPGFRHNEQSLRVVDLLERDGQGLNLTLVTRDGILTHSTARDANGQLHQPATPEAMVVRLADDIAWMNHDLDDAVRAGLLHQSEIPPVVVERLGATHSTRINTLVTSVIASSQTDEAPAVIAIDPDIAEAATVLRDFLFARVYLPLNEQDDALAAVQIVRTLFLTIRDYPELLPPLFRDRPGDDSLERRVADYLASMTDRYAITLYEQLDIAHNGREPRPRATTGATLPREHAAP